MTLSREMIILPGTAAFIGFFHTLLGPDHYLPFIVSRHRLLISPLNS